VPSYKFIQLDVFTDQPFTGNPLAVFPEGEGLNGEQMQQIAREMNLSESVFVLPSDKEGVLRKLRIFTPFSELPFAGHPIAGTWNCLAREGIVPAPEGGTGTVKIKHEVGIGVLPVEIDFKAGEPTRVVMTQGKFEIKAEIDDWQDQADIARGLGLSREDLDETLPIQACSTGNTMLMVPIRSLADLGRCRTNIPLLEEVYARNGFTSSGATGCYAFTRETIEVGASRAHARFFAPSDNMPEDPATGSASGPLGCYLVHHRIVSGDAARSIVSQQGVAMGRPSRIHIAIGGGPEAINDVKVGGHAVLVGRGEIVV